MTSSVADSPICVSDGRGANRWFFAFFLVFVTFIAYIPAWHGGFVWKDDQFILHNPYINFWQGLYRIWFKTSSIQYYPLTYTTFWTEYNIWGMNPLGYHLVNIGLHALDAILVWFVLLRLNVPGAWLASAIFALHPVNVESVAWIVERKNTLSTAFYLCSILAGLRFWLPEYFRRGDEALSKTGLQQTSELPEKSETPHVVSYGTLTDWKYYWLCLVLFVCALFCKTTTIPLPAVMLLLVWWKRGRITRRDVYLCIPFVVAGVAVGLITHHVEHNLGAAGKEFEFTLVDRILLAARNFWFYLGKLVWPHPLMFVYPRWTIRPSSPIAWLAVVAFVPVLGVLWLARKTWGRTVFIAFAYFGGMLFFVLGFFNVFFFLYSFVSDHFVYLACMGPFALFAAALTVAMCRTAEKSETPDVVSYGYYAICACLLVVLAVLTWRQAGAYSSDIALWRDTIEKNPRAFLAYNNLGSILYNRGQLDAAIVEYEKSVAIHPDTDIYHNLGNSLLQRGKVADAYGYFQKALKLQPDSGTAYLDLGTYYLQTGRTDLAIPNFQKAVQLQPDLAMAWYNLGNAYLQNRQLDAAIPCWQKAINLQPDSAMAHNNLGNAYQLKGQVALAIENWKSAYMEQPNLLPAQINLAWAWATCPDGSLRDAPDSLALAEQANRLTGGANPMVLRVLAAALAENGRYPDAVAAAQQALQLSHGNAALISSVQSQLAYYRKNQPFRDQGAGPAGAIKK